MTFDYQFCPKCGGKLLVKFTEGRDRQVCSACEFVFYRNPIPAVAVILREGEKILLVRRKYEPCQGDWSLPAGFVEWGESPEETAVREAKEETNLDIALRELYGVFRARGERNYEIVLVVYRAEILSGELQAGDDAMEARYFKLTELPDNVAFRVHRQILARLAKEER